jgi:hypothetical protein
MSLPPIQHDPTYGLSAEVIEYARRRYVETDDSQGSIARDIGKSPGTLDRLAKAQGWPLRKDRPPRGLPPETQLAMQTAEALAGKASGAPQPQENAVAPDGPPVAGSIAARLEAALERELRKVEILRGDFGTGGKRSFEAERVARTLATLTETLFRVRRLREPGSISGSNDDDLPADADGFRLALAYRIEAFVRSRVDGDVSERVEPADGEPAAS